MSVSYLVWYDGSAKDAAAFVSFYEQEHIPILMLLPGIQKVVLHTSVDANDPFPTHPRRPLLLAQMIFETIADLDAALQSPAREVARTHFETFPEFEGGVYHIAVESREVFPA